MQKTDLKGKELNSPRLIKGFHFALDLKINFKHASLVILLKNLHLGVLEEEKKMPRTLSFASSSYNTADTPSSVLLGTFPFVKGIHLQTHFQCKMVHLHAFPIRLLLIPSMLFDLISSASQSHWC